MDKKQISVILPIHKKSSFIHKGIASLADQTYKNFQLIIVDSSIDGIDEIADLSNLHQEVKIVRAKGAFPGEARNKGIENSDFELISFIDLKTLPKSDWLEDALVHFKDKSLEVLLGKGRGIASNYNQRLIKALTYGNKSFRCLPGTIITRKALKKSGFFVKAIRAGEDIEWISRLNTLSLNIKIFEKTHISYYGFPETFAEAIKKWYLYSIENSKINILTSQKVMYSYVCLLGFLYFIYSWNFVFTFGQWDRSDAFIPNLNSIVWNSLFLIYFLARSLIIPFLKKEYLLFLFPINWLLVGAYGFLLDLIKIPGRISGLIRILQSKN